MFDERIDVSGVGASDALMTQSELCRVNQATAEQLEFFFYYIQAHTESCNCGSDE